MKKLALALLALFAVTTAGAGLITQSGSRCHGCSAGGGGEGGEWADVYVTTDEVGPELATDGRIVGIRGTTVEDYALTLTPGNGASVTRLPLSSFDSAEDAIEMIPPSNATAQYAGIMNTGLGAGVGGLTIRQLNWRFLVYFGSTWWSHSPNSKFTGVLMSATNSSPGDAPKRAAIFDQRWSPPTPAQKVLAVTYGTTQSYHEPDSGVDAGDEEDKLVYIRSSANHSNDPPIIGPEWICMEQVVTTPGYNGQTDGRNKLYVTTRDGVVNAASLDIPFSYAGDYDPSKIYITALEYLGGYFNDGGTADANNFVMFSHVALASNMGADEVIGCPPGFNTGFLLLLVLQLSWLRAAKRALMKRAIAVLLLLCAATANAAPTFDASGSAGAGCSADATPTVDVTVSAGSDRYGIGYIYWEGAVTVSAAAFGAQTPTLHATHSGTNFQMYRLDDPSTGAQTFSVTISGAPSRCYIAWVTYQATASVGTAAEGYQPEGTTLTVDVSSATGDLVVDGAMFGGGVINVGAGQTSRVEQDDFDEAGRSFGVSEEAGASTVTMSWTTGGGNEEGFILAANLVAAGGGGGSSGLLRRRRSN